MTERKKRRHPFYRAYQHLLGQPVFAWDNLSNKVKGILTDIDPERTYPFRVRSDGDIPVNIGYRRVEALPDPDYLGALAEVERFLAENKKLLKEFR